MANLKPRHSSAAADSLPGVLFGHKKPEPAPESELDWGIPASAPPDSLTEFRVPGSVVVGTEDTEWVLPLAPPAPLPRLISSGTYDIALELGGGAMATVYMAVKSGSNGFKKIVALKRIHKHLAGNSTFVDMLVDEARLASRINHPNVCQVLDFGSDDSGYYIALEFLSGQTLQAIFDRLAAKPETLAHERHQFIVTRIIASLAQGLHAAHNLKGDDGLSLDVVHRDVTPHNLFLLYDGMAKVTDFGVARARSRIHQTADGALKGKLAYMAPEQISRRSLDRRADVFALGVVFWELLTGRRLFDYKSEAETLTAVCSGGVPAPSRYQSGISPQLDAIVLRALSIRETERYQTARELSGALETFLARSSDTVPLIDLVDWLADLFPGAEAQSEAVQRKVLETAPSAPDAERPRFVPAASVAQLKSAHVVNDEDLWPMGDSSPPSRTPGSVDAVLRQAEAAPPPLIIPSDEPSTSTGALSAKAIRRALGEVSDAPGPTDARARAKLGSTLLLTAVALIMGVVAGLIALRHRFVEPSAAPATSLPVDTALAAPIGAAPIEVPRLAPANAAPSAVVPASGEPASLGRARRPPASVSSPAPAGGGAVFITSSGGPAAVLIAGTRVGNSPMLLNLPVGPNVVTLVPSNGKPARDIAVQVRAHETSVIKADFGQAGGDAPPPLSPVPTNSGG